MYRAKACRSGELARCSGVAVGSAHKPIGADDKGRAGVARMAALSAQYPRYGHRRLAIFLPRDGQAMSFGRAHRLCRLARLQVPQKRPRKRIAAGTPREDRPVHLPITIDVQGDLLPCLGRRGALR
jgi:hypothetical protein